MRAAPSASAPRAIGSTSRNIQRQSSTLRISPEIVGPMAGATEMTIEMLPMVRPRDAGGTSVITVVISSGIMMAVPLACTTRANSSTSKPGASAAISVPVLNSVMAVMKTGRVLKRCSRIAGDRDHHGHGQHERGGQPLRRARGDVEVAASGAAARRP